MNIYEFGLDNEQILLMFHGSCMSWDMFQEDIDSLEKYYHIIIPALPGHDLKNNSNYTSVEKIAEDMQEWLLMRNIRQVHGIYGLSMGGSIVIRLLANNRIHFGNAIIDAGITPYSYPKVITNLIAVKDFFFTELGKHSRKMLEFGFSPQKYPKEVIDSLKKVLKHMNATTIYRVFKSCNNYSMPSVIPELETRIQYWYGTVEKKQRELDIAYVKKVFTVTEFVEFKNLDHGEFAMRYPKEFVEKVQVFLK
jgi:pimeloyl-ACP methyl ester carboxylesterase